MFRANTLPGRAEPVPVYDSFRHAPRTVRAADVRQFPARPQNSAGSSETPPSFDEKAGPGRHSPNPDRVQEAFLTL